MLRFFAYPINRLELALLLRMHYRNYSTGNSNAAEDIQLRFF